MAMVYSTPAPHPPVVNETLIGGMLADFNGDGKLDFAEEVGFSSMRYDFSWGMVTVSYRT